MTQDALIGMNARNDIAHGVGRFFGSHRLAVALLAVLPTLGCNPLQAEETEPVEPTIAEAEADHEAAPLEIPRRASTQMILQQQAEPNGSGIATDPVAERVLNRVRVVDTSDLERPLADAVVEDDGTVELIDVDGEPEPVAFRIARQTLTVRTEPSHRAALRGRIPMSEAFEVFAFVDGQGEDKGCGGLGWAEVGGGYVCLERSRKAAGKAPRTLPRLRKAGVTPHYYAKVPHGRSAQQWASIAAYRAGEPALHSLSANHDYAFVARKMSKGEVFLIDQRRRVVPERQMSRFYPSAFEGRDLQAEPVPEGVVLAWTIDWPETALRAEASTQAPLAASLDYHAPLMLEPEPIGKWYRVSDGSGFVHANSVRRWTAPEPLSVAAAGETWVDVDLQQQTLTVMKGKTPVFATLISSGFKSPTPRGIFRIRLKQATGTMSSSPGAKDSYAVEEVPNVQYFFNSFALHSAYWHNRFGHKMSHGCVNLSPKDARTVYDVTGPHPRDGWMHAYESESDLGTTVRIREGSLPVRDRRTEVESVFG